MDLARSLKGNRGVATSLIEAVMVIAISAILLSVAAAVALDRVDDARASRAIAETEMIGVAVHSFMRDTLLAPAFKNGLMTSGLDEVFRILETGGVAPVTASTLRRPWPVANQDRDRIENHIVMNQPGGVSGVSYPRVGSLDFDRHRGWNGPYLSRLPESDPWGDRYLINVELLTPQGIDRVRQELEAADPGFEVPAGRRFAVIVLSAGANRTIETEYGQPGEEFAAGGDDIVFRIQ